MGSLAVPGANRRPLSNHGLPKQPRATSPDFPHRFSPLSYPQQTFVSGPSSPLTPGLMSPPMSAKSFGTFIDSAPSTPAYSPRLNYEWDAQPLVILRPMSSSSEPASPSEPAWNMAVSPKEPQQVVVAPTTEPEARSMVPKERPVMMTSLSAPPVNRLKAWKQNKQQKEKKTAEQSGLEKWPPLEEEELEEKVDEEHASEASLAPLGKLASRMRSMLRRRSTTDTKKEKKERKREKDYYDPIEDVHWTEM
jgi:pyruvate dehydrogenase phosphatase